MGAVQGLADERHSNGTYIHRGTGHWTLGVERRDFNLSTISPSSLRYSILSSSVVAIWSNNQPVIAHDARHPIIASLFKVRCVRARQVLALGPTHPNLLFFDLHACPSTIFLPPPSKPSSQELLEKSLYDSPSRIYAVCLLSRSTAPAPFCFLSARLVWELGR